MGKYEHEALTEALKVVTATIANCEKIQPKFLKGTSQHTLLENRINALYLSKALIEGESHMPTYSEEDLTEALKPIVSIINKCESGQRKHEAASVSYRRFQKTIDAMKVCKTLIADEIGKYHL